MARGLREISDPKALRAVAHPFRLRLLDLMERRGTLTSAEAAAATGESTGSCSFHLRQLAKYGYVEEAEARDGRERRWRRVAGGERIPDSSDPVFARATAEVGRVLLERAVVEAEEWLRRHRDLPKSWQQGAVLDDELLFLTATELRTLSRQVLALLGEYRERTTSPSRRPPAARPVRAVALLFPTREDE